MLRSSSYLIGFVILITSSLLLAQDSTATADDSIPRHTGISLGVGFPSGINLALHQDLFDFAYLEGGTGIIYPVYATVSAGIKFRVRKPSTSVIGVRYSYFYDTWGSAYNRYSYVSVWYGGFSLLRSEPSIYGGIGLVVPAGSNGSSVYPFFELTWRIASFF